MFKYQKGQNIKFSCRKNTSVVYTKTHTFTTFFHKKAKASRIRFNLAAIGICKNPAADLHTVKNKNHTGINRFRDVDKEGFLVSPGGHFHKKILVELFASARLEVFPAYINLKVLNAPF